MLRDFDNTGAVQARVQLSGGQTEQLLACRRALLHEVGALITEWDGLWSDLEVGPPEP